MPGRNQVPIYVRRSEHRSAEFGRSELLYLCLNLYQKEREQIRHKYLVLRGTEEATPLGIPVGLRTE